MPSYLIHERMLCEVTFVRRVEAEDEDAALDASYDGEGELLGVSVGDQHPGRDDCAVLPDAPHNLPPCFYPEPPAPEARTLDAIRARLAGEWDNPALVALGPLMPDMLADIHRILAEETKP